MKMGILFCVAITMMLVYPGVHSTGQEDIEVRAFIVGKTIRDMDSIRKMADRLGLEMGEPLKYVPYQLVWFRNRHQINEILCRDDVVRIQEELSVDISQDVSVRNVKAAPSKRYSVDTAHELGFKGEGITIAIIDSGVDNNEHPMFKDSFVAGADFTSPESPLNPRDGSLDPDDLDGHGTGVASVALGRGYSDGEHDYVGVAPEAGLIDLRVYKMRPAMENPIAAALEWCLDNRETDWGNGYHGVDVISISAGLGRQDGPIHSIISMCVGNGIPVISAATNSGESFDDNANGPNYWSDDSIIVGGTDDMRTVDRNDDQYWPRSTWGPRSDDGDDDPYDELKPDVSAPASDITVADKSAAPDSTKDMVTLSGTSYATSHVSGTVALMLQANSGIRPGHEGNPVRSILHRTAEARGEPYDLSLSDKYNVHYGYGILDSHGAVLAARDHSTDNAPPKIREFRIVPSTATVGSICSVVLDVFDPDQDTIEFEFEAEGGEVLGAHPDLQYRAPSIPGRYGIHVTVFDPRGGTDASSFTVDVIEGKPNDPPSIIRMRADPEKVRFGEKLTITVIARDPDGDPLQYKWASSSGSLDANGNVAILTAGNKVGTIIVEVIVTDPFEGADSDSIRVRVTGAVTGNPPFVESVDLDPDSIRKGDRSVDVILKVKVTSDDSYIRRVYANLSSMDMGTIDLIDTGSYPDDEKSDDIYSLRFPPLVDIDTGSYDIVITAEDAGGRVSTAYTTLFIKGPISENNGLEDENRTTMNTVLVISLMVLVAIVMVFAVLRITKRTPR